MHTQWCKPVANMRSYRRNIGSHVPRHQTHSSWARIGLAYPAIFVPIIRKKMNFGMAWVYRQLSVSVR